MDDANFLPNDLAACQRLLLAAFQQSVELEHQVADAKRHAAEATQQATELSRVLDETAASYQELQQAHAATLDELAWYRRWAFGRRRERFAESEGQGHLFELDSRRASLTMMFKLAQAAQKRWRRLNGYQHLTHLLEGKQFVNGVMQDAA